MTKKEWLENAIKAKQELIEMWDGKDVGLNEKLKQDIEILEEIKLEFEKQKVDLLISKKIKIKKDFDLKELEKYGFYQSNEVMNSWSYELKFIDKFTFCEEPFAILDVVPEDLTLEFVLVKADDECMFDLGDLYCILNQMISDEVAYIVEEGYDNEN